MKKITIAIDGYSACGKSTMAKSLAHNINYIYIDSGAMYRAITLYSLDNNIIDKNGGIDEKKLRSEINKIKITFRLDGKTNQPVTYLNEENVEERIRAMDVSSRVSAVSSLGFVRRAMVALQQEMGEKKGIVMDGRDIGTVVFPDAELKIFVTADPEVRAQRRLDELRSKGDNKTTYAEVLENLQKRDYADENRLDSPLKKAEDALLLDNSSLNKEQQMQWVLEKYKEALKKYPNE